jgi:hypothetical protein
MGMNAHAIELIPWQDHNARGLTANDHIERLRVTHPDIARDLGRVVEGLIEAMQAAYVELHKAEYASQLAGDYSPSTSKPVLKAAAANAGFELMPWDGKL